MSRKEALTPLEFLEIIPSSETLYTHDDVCESFVKDLKQRSLLDKVDRRWIHHLEKKKFFQEIPFLLKHFYPNLESPLDYFPSPFSMIILNPKACKIKLEELKKYEKDLSQDHLSSRFDEIYTPYDKIIHYISEKTSLSENVKDEVKRFFVSDIGDRCDLEISSTSSPVLHPENPLGSLKELRSKGVCVFIGSIHSTEREALKLCLEDCGLEPVCIEENRLLMVILD